MKAIEEDYPSLKGVLPKNYSIFSSGLLRELLRIFNKEVLQKANGDLFGKIYEYFLNKFAMTGAQEGGEFFTPFSLVNTIVNVIEPDHGIVFDPACGSAGMFVQTGYFIEKKGGRPAEKVTFYGQEKAETNTKLSRMNLAVHGLEGAIVEGNTFYEDKHNLVGNCDFVMANPPFNVDGVDKQKDIVKKDPRLPFGLPKNDNANYLWIQYFYSYLKPPLETSLGGRAGFVMASSASDAGHSEKEIRAGLVKKGAVDVMIAIGNNFFYTKSLPCTLWFFDRSKEADKERKEKVLMLDVRKIYRKVTQKINDFSPEQLRNIACIVSLYRGSNEMFKTIVQEYLQTSSDFAMKSAGAIADLQKKIKEIIDKVYKFSLNYKGENKDELQKSLKVLQRIQGISPVPESAEILEDTEVNSAYEVTELKDAIALFSEQETLSMELKNVKPDLDLLENFAHRCKAMKKPQDKVIKLLIDLIADVQKEYQLNKNKDWKELDLKEQIEQLKTLHQHLSGNAEEEEPGLLHDVEYFWKQAHWLVRRFLEGKYIDVEGLCKVVTVKEIEEKDYSLSPGRYVGVDTSMNDDFDYEERLKEIHIELEGLNEEANKLAKTISENYKDFLV